MDREPIRTHGATRLARDQDAPKLPETAQRRLEAHVVALERLRHSDRITTLGLFAASVAHELGNPLNVIELRAQLIASSTVATLPQALKSAAVIVEQTQRMTRILDEVLSFARVPPVKITRLDLVEVLRDAVMLCEPTAKKHGARIALGVPNAAIEIDGDIDGFLQIVVNLVVHGVQVTPAGGTLRVSVCNEVRAPADDPEGMHRPHVCITVADEGVGIAPDLLAKVFDPFFSSRQLDGGTGFGLSVAQAIARRHEGWIDVESEPGRGSRFRVHLPTHGVRVEGGHGT